MQDVQHSTIFKLVTVWALLMGATIVTMIAGSVTQILTIGPIWVGVLLAVTWLKANLIVSYFLNLKAAKKSWQQIFNLLIGAIILVIYVLYLAF